MWNSPFEAQLIKTPNLFKHVPKYLVGTSSKTWIETQLNISSWWFQPIWKILVKSKWIISSNRGEHNKSLKPPPRFVGSSNLHNKRKDWTITGSTGSKTGGGSADANYSRNVESQWFKRLGPHGPSIRFPWWAKKKWNQHVFFGRDLERIISE